VGVLSFSVLVVFAPPFERPFALSTEVRRSERSAHLSAAQESLPAVRRREVYCARADECARRSGSSETPLRHAHHAVYLDLPNLRIDSEDPRLTLPEKLALLSILELRVRYNSERRPREEHATTRCAVIMWFALTQESQFFVDSSRLSALEEIEDASSTDR
jgi:hypothetical protein